MKSTTYENGERIGEKLRGEKKDGRGGRKERKG